MKLKKYKILIKVEFQTSLIHEQTTKEKAEKDIIGMVQKYINEGLNFNEIFEDKPFVTCKAIKYVE